MNPAAQSYFDEFLAQLPIESSYHSRRVLAEGWGDGPAMADELGALIAAGTKTATCSALAEWEHDGDDLPEPGLLTVVLDGTDEPLCIVETSEVNIQPFNQVEADFAYDEGEGDRSLAYWRRVHRKFFERIFERIGGQFSEDMLLVCERFRVIYPKDIA
jgi:uncharacterized protein YhfF